MTEAETPEISSLPPRFELEEVDDYSQYLLHSRSEIVSVLRTLIQKMAMVTIYFDQGRSFLLSAIIAISNDTQEFILDIGSDDEMNRKALAADKLILTTLIDKVKVQFSINGVRLIRHEGHAAFAADLPEKLLRLQRREFFRLSTSVANPVKLSTTISHADFGNRFIEVPLLDISCGGVGLMVTPDQLHYFRKGETLDQCKIMLPGEGPLVTTVGIRNMFEVTTRSGARFVRVGGEFATLSAAKLTLVQRYITRVERERKARLSGIA